MSRALLAAYGGTPLITVDAAEFDGTNDYITNNSSSMSGVSDGSKGILSCWYRPGASYFGSSRMLLDNVGASAVGGLQVNTARFIGQDNIRLIGQDSSQISKVSLLTLNNYISEGTWYHLLASWDNTLSDPSQRLYVNDVFDVNTVVNVSGNMNLTTAGHWYIGGQHTVGANFIGAMAEFYFAPGQYLDLSVTENRRKFRSASGKPVYLGTNGSLPTGTAPAIYFHLDDGETANNFGTNRGTGGSFSVGGSLTTASSSPSD